MKKKIPLGIEDFQELIENNYYYVDKTGLISEWLEHGTKVTLITRPRRFGKTLGMSMVREFFDLTKESKSLFDGLAIMNTKYKDQINTRPVIFLSFKDCSASDPEELIRKLSNILFKEYHHYADIFEEKVNKHALNYVEFYYILDKMVSKTIKKIDLYDAISVLVNTVSFYYKEKVILLIDEYDQPILSSYEYQFREELQSFFSDFYTSALKGNEALFAALLTGIQRVAKESIFSKLNNVVVYTMLHDKYSSCFGMNTKETKDLLHYYGYELNDSVKTKYDGYLFGKIEMYNPWSVLNYASSGKLAPYWINTSTNALIKKSLKEADDSFQERFHQLLSNGTVNVSISLETSFIELKNNSTLWGLLINSGYVTVIEQIQDEFVTVRIPNDEVKSEFQKLVAEQANIQDDDLKAMLHYLISGEIKAFVKIYEKIVLSCTSYFDAKENAYHMLFLGMCISLRGVYKITSNIESGYGRSDITLESLSPSRFHIIVEFKQGEDLDSLTKEALNQMMEKQYYTGLKGKILLLGIAHNAKRCKAESKMIEI